MPIPDRIVSDEDALDDLYFADAEVHIERLSKRQFYIGVYKGDRLIQLDAKDVQITYDSAERGEQQTPHPATQRKIVHSTPSLAAVQRALQSGAPLTEEKSNGLG